MHAGLWGITSFQNISIVSIFDIARTMLAIKWHGPLLKPANILTCKGKTSTEIGAVNKTPYK